MKREIKRIAITGPTGAIGIALMNHCIEENIAVLAICRPGSSRIARVPKHPLVKVLELDLCEMENASEEVIRKAVSDGPVDAFFHFGWAATIGDGRNDMQLQTQNIRYALDAVHLAKRMGAKVYIGAGSQAEYGRVEGALSAETPAFPENGYGMAKLCAGEMTRVECEKLGIEHIWTRILSIYGPYDGELTMITSTIRKLFAGEIPALTKGEQQWDYLYNKDAARAMLLIAQFGEDHKIYPIGSGKVRPLREYIEILRDSVDSNLALGIGEVPYGPKQVMYLCADISELAQDTGFTPKYSFEEGIKETIQWVKENDR